MKKKLSEKLYKLSLLISMIYVTIIFIFISYIFYHKVFNETNFLLRDKAVYIKEKKSVLINEEIKNNKFILEQIFNTTGKKELSDILNYYVVLKNKKDIENTILKNFFHNGMNFDKVTFIYLDRIQGNLIKLKNRNFFTVSSYRGVVEKNKVLSFKTNKITLQDSKYYNIYAIFNTSGKIIKLNISLNKYFPMIVKNKEVIKYIKEDPKTIYNYLNNEILNSFIITKLRTEQIKTFKVLGNTFKNNDLISLIKINNVKYKILIHDERITKIEKY